MKDFLKPTQSKEVYLRGTPLNVKWEGKVNKVLDGTSDEIHTNLNENNIGFSDPKISQG